MSRTSAKGEVHLPLCYSGPTNNTSDRRPSVDGPNYQGGDRQDCRRARASTFVSNITASTNDGDSQHRKLSRFQIPCQPYVQKHTFLPQNSLPLGMGDTELCIVDSSDITTPTCPHYSTESTKVNKGRRPKKSKTNYLRGAPESKLRDGRVLGNLHGSQRKFLHGREATLEKVHRALQRSYYYTLSEGHENVKTLSEEHASGDECGSLPEPLCRAGTGFSSGQRQEPNT
ncbi:hypothetical protein FXO37_22413 [Capsicum annuum]|nr:hypothetical protein FXO37_22413 [Capsicum annuum]